MKEADNKHPVKKHPVIPGEQIIPVCSRNDCPVKDLKNPQSPYQIIHRPCEDDEYSQCEGLAQILQDPPLEPNLN